MTTVTTTTTTTKPLPIDHPSHVWNMIDTPAWDEAVLSMSIGLRDWAMMEGTPEEVEVHAQLVGYLMSDAFENHVEAERRVYAARLSVGQSQPEPTTAVDPDRIREHQDAIQKARHK
ncbi:MAG: hypothetical protein AAF066_03165 [Pseudomonadota bacterium]